MRFRFCPIEKSAFAILCCIVFSSAPLLAKGKTTTNTAASRKTQWIQNAIEAGYLTAAQAAAAKGNVAKINAAIRANNEQREVQTAIEQGLVTAEEVQRVNANRQRIKDLIALRADKDLTNASDEALQKAKDEYLKNPGKGGKEHAQLILAADALGIDEEKVRDAGITTSRDLFGLVAQLALVGDEKANTRIQTAEFWQDVKTKGKDGVVRDAYAESVGISPQLVAKMKLRDVMNAAAAAQDLKLDATSPDFWTKVGKDGVPGLYKDKLKEIHKLPAEAVKDLTLKEIQAGIKAAKGDKAKLRDPEYWKDLKEKANEAKSDTKNVGDGAVQNAAKPPLKGPGGIGVAEVIVVTRKLADKGKTTDAASVVKAPPASNAASVDGGRFGGVGGAGAKDAAAKAGSDASAPNAGSSGRNVADNTAANGANSGASSAAGQSDVGQNNAALQGAGGSQTSGSSNPSGTDAPSATSGSGFSQNEGEEAGTGGVYSVIGMDQESNGSVSYTWMASGTMGNDGLYITTYTQDSAGNWTWTVEKALTGEVVNSGTGNPPDASVVGTSTQSTDGDEMVFPTSDSTSGSTNEGTGNGEKKEDDSDDDKDDDGDGDGDNADATTDDTSTTGTETTDSEDKTEKTDASSTPNPDAETRSNPIQNWSLPGGKSTERRDKRGLADRKGGGHTDPSESDSQFGMGVATLGLQMLLENQNARRTEQSIGAQNGSHFGAPSRGKIAYVPTASEIEDMLIRVGVGVTTPTPDAPAGSGIIGGLVGTPLGGLPPTRGGQFSAGRLNVNVRNKLKSNVVSGQ